jgi:hypothetical protein
MLSGTYEPRWRSLRFDALQVERRWPDGAPSPPPLMADSGSESSAEAKARGGRPPKFDWIKWEDALETECRLQESVPHEGHSAHDCGARPTLSIISTSDLICVQAARRTR